jgi:iron-sulfur cluster assembly accessory protein
MTLAVENPTTIEQVTTDVLHLSENAAARVKQLIEERDLEGYALRVFVSGGGCSGFQYGMGLDDKPRDDDMRFNFSDIQVIIDPMSMSYMSGATIDYVEDIMGGGFKIENPNAVSSCGCGHSFRTEGEAPAHSHSHGGGCC